MTLVVMVFGATALILFGGYKELSFWGLRESTIRNRLGHLQIYKRGYFDGKSQKPLDYALDDVAQLRQAIEADPRVKATAAQITLMGLISNGDKSETFLATAVEPGRDKMMAAQRLLSGQFISDKEPDGVIIGEGLARSMNVKPGDYLTLMTTTVRGSLNAMDVRVAGTFATGVKEYDDRAVKMPIQGAQQLLQTQKVEKMLVMLKETEQTGAVEADLAALFSKRGWNLEMKDWSKLATFYHQVVLIYNGIFGFLGIVVFAIVVVSVANTIMMSIFERTREIGTLMAIGTKRIRLWAMFLLEGLFIGILGGALGLLVGWSAGTLINHAHIQLPPPPGYTRGYPLQIMFKSSILVIAFVLSVITATVSSILPALKATRLRIVDALGHI
jgi:putative ABC transport system permease protein